LFMREAISVAQAGMELGQAPFGAVVVIGGKTIASAHNSVRATVDPTAHAEIMAIRKSCSKLYTTSLEDSTIYTTCEPCLMCLSACFWAGVKKIVYGATIADAASHGIRQINAPLRQVLSLYGDYFVVTHGVLRDDCVKLFDKWARSR
jgi:tRNA(Arg) A34 adenosine deaminase TadA